MPMVSELVMTPSHMDWFLKTVYFFLVFVKWRVNYFREQTWDSVEKLYIYIYILEIDTNFFFWATCNSILVYRKVLQETIEGNIIKQNLMGRQGGVDMSQAIGNNIRN